MKNIKKISILLIAMLLAYGAGCSLTISQSGQAFANSYDNSEDYDVADDDDEDDYDYDDYDEWNDWEDEDDEVSYKPFEHVVYTAKRVTITKNRALKGSITNKTNKAGCTRVYPFTLTKKQTLRLEFSDKTDADMTIAIVDDSGKIIEKKHPGSVSYSGKRYSFTLKKGKYSLKIFTESNWLEKDSYYFTLSSVEKTTNRSMAACTTTTLKPGLGKGQWKTSNASIVSLSQKSGSTCRLRAKKTGTATVTFKNSKGTCKYKIRVYKYKEDPFRAGYISVNSVGGIEPTLLVVNESNKTIKYIDFKVSFYNAVGDRVYNDIGFYSTAKLQIIGPLKPWHGDYYEWYPIFYNTVAHRMYIKEAVITYMDNTKKKISVKKSYYLGEKKFDERLAQL